MTMDDVTITYPGIISHKSLSFHPTPASITQDVEDRCRKRYEFFQKFSIFFFFPRILARRPPEKIAVRARLPSSRED